MFAVEIMNLNHRDCKSQRFCRPVWFSFSDRKCEFVCGMSDVVFLANDKLSFTAAEGKSVGVRLSVTLSPHV